MSNKYQNKFKIFGIMLATILLILIGIVAFPKEEKIDDKGLKNPNKTNIEAAFVDIRWTRTTETDTEYISFNRDGTFSYSCACGNPVNDSDLCEYYTYDKDTKEIEFICEEETEEMITNVDVIRVTDKELELSFGGDKRIFKIEETE